MKDRTTRSTRVIRIDTDSQYQKIRHFGASAAWWAQEVGTWPAETQDRILRLLFSREEGIGLNLIRYNLGGGKAGSEITDPWRSAETPLKEDGTFDWSRDRAALNIIDRASDLGAEVVLFANTPPSVMTRNGKSYGSGGECNLKEGSEDDFAAYLIDAALDLRKTRGWNIREISPINEPQWKWALKNGQEGCHWIPEEAFRMVRSLQRQIRDRALDFSVSAVDSADMKMRHNRKFIKLLLEDRSLKDALDHYAVHSYWSGLRHRKRLRQYFDRYFPEKEIWMTEWTEMKKGRDTGMDSALNLARTVHEDLTVTGASSWQYWIALSCYDFRDGLIYVDPVKKSFEETRRLRALGNWSRFIRPGARRVETTGGAGRHLLVSAFLNPDGSLCTVLVNRGRRSEAISLELTGKGYSRMTVHETSESRALEEVSAGSPGEITLPAESVTTVVFN